MKRSEYTGTRVVGGALVIAGALALLASLLVIVVAVGTPVESPFAALFLGFSAYVTAVLASLFILAAGLGLWALCDVADNSRRTVFLLEKQILLHKAPDEPTAE